MEHYEEIFSVIKKWFDLSLNISIKIPGDLLDGRYYLELLKCDELDIHNSKSENYAKIEKILDEFYGFRTSYNVDYWEFCYGTGSEEVKISTTINLCMFCIVFCQECNRTPKDLKDDDFKRLYFLTEPVKQALKDKKQPSQDSIIHAIEKAKEKELDDVSAFSNSATHMTKSNTDSLKINCTLVGSDDDISTSSCIRSNRSENSFSARRFRDPHNESIGELSSHDGSKSSLRRSNKHFIINKARRNQDQFLSPLFRRTVNSPKLNESRKMEQRRLRDLDCENHSLKQEICNINKDLETVEVIKNKLVQDNGKLKIDNRKLMDEIDCLKCKVEESELIGARKEKELDKIRKENELGKKALADKSDEVKQLEHSNHKLRQDIHELNSKLKSKSSQCEKSMKIDIDRCQEQLALQHENEVLQTHIEELTEQLKELRHTMNLHQHRSAERDTMLDSPVSTFEIGESLDIINEMKLVELKDHFENEKLRLEQQIDDLKSVINTDRISQQQELASKLSQSAERVKELESKLGLSQEEIEYLREKNLALSQESRITGRTEMGLEGVLELLGDLLESDSGIGRLSETEKADFVQRVTELVGLSPPIYPTGIDSGETVSKESMIAELARDLSETERELHSTQRELAEALANSEHLGRSWQAQRAKTDEDGFRLKKTLVAVEEERRKVQVVNNELQQELLVRDQALQAANEEFNSLRVRYDQSLRYLDRMSRHCDDYERMVRDLSERVSPPLAAIRHSACQTAADWMGPARAVLESPRSLSTALASPRHNSAAMKPVYHATGTDPAALIARPGVTGYPRDPARQQSGVRPRVHDPPAYYLRNNETSRNRPASVSEICSFSTTATDSGSRFDPQWVAFDRPSRLVSAVSQTAARKPESPAVKPARLQQMIARNLQQPEHLRSSYPVETQALDERYLAHMLIREIDPDAEDLDDTDNEMAGRSHSFWRGHYTASDPMNLRPGIGGVQAGLQYEQNPFSNELIKGSSSNGVTPRSAVLSARSNNNFNTPRTEVFKVPMPPSKIGVPCRDSNRENIMPLNDMRKETFFSYDIPNSPKGNAIGIPRRSKVPEKFRFENRS